MRFVGRGENISLFSPGLVNPVLGPGAFCRVLGGMKPSTLDSPFCGKSEFFFKMGASRAPPSA